MSNNSKIDWTRTVYEIEASDIGTSLKMATAKPLKALAGGHQAGENAAEEMPAIS